MFWKRSTVKAKTVQPVITKIPKPHAFNDAWIHNESNKGIWETIRKTAMIVSAVLAVWCWAMTMQKQNQIDSITSSLLDVNNEQHPWYQANAILRTTIKQQNNIAHDVVRISWAFSHMSRHEQNKLIKDSENTVNRVINATEGIRKEHYQVISEEHNAKKQTRNTFRIGWIIAWLSAFWLALLKPGQKTPKKQTVKKPKRNRRFSMGTREQWKKLWENVISLPSKSTPEETFPASTSTTSTVVKTKPESSTKGLSSKTTSTPKAIDDVTHTGEVEVPNFLTINHPENTWESIELDIREHRRRFIEMLKIAWIEQKRHLSQIIEKFENNYKHNIAWNDIMKDFGAYFRCAFHEQDQKVVWDKIQILTDILTEKLNTSPELLIRIKWKSYKKTPTEISSVVAW